MPGEFPELSGDAKILLRCACSLAVFSYAAGDKLKT